MNEKERRNTTQCPLLHSSHFVFRVKTTEVHQVRLKKSFEVILFILVSSTPFSCDPLSFVVGLKLNVILNINWLIS